MVDLQKNSKPAVRVAIIGCGKIGSLWDENEIKSHFSKTHAKGFAQNPDCEIVAFMDANKSRAEAASAFWKSGMATDSFSEVLKTNPDVICLCTPESQRLNFLHQIPRDKKFIIVCEKPLCENWQQALEIEALVKSTQWTFIVNYIRRYARGFKKLQELLKTKALGEVQSIHATYGKGLKNGGTHMMDLFHLLCGSAPVNLQHLTTVTDDRLGFDPTMGLYLEYQDANGQTIPTHLVTTDHRHFTVFELTCLFEKGRLQMRNSGHTLNFEKIGIDPHYPDYKILEQSEVWTESLSGYFENLAQEVVDLHQGRVSKPTSSLETALLHMKCVEIAHLSASQNGQRLEIHYNNKS